MIAIETSIDRHLFYLHFILVSAFQQDYAYNHQKFQMQTYSLPIRMQMHSSKLDSLLDENRRSQRFEIVCFNFTCICTHPCSLNSFCLFSRKPYRCQGAITLLIGSSRWCKTRELDSSRNDSRKNSRRGSILCRLSGLRSSFASVMRRYFRSGRYTRTTKFMV